MEVLIGIIAVAFAAFGGLAWFKRRGEGCDSPMEAMIKKNAEVARQYEDLVDAQMAALPPKSRKKMARWLREYMDSEEDCD